MKKKPIILGIESSCDETAVSIIQENNKGQPSILSNIVSSQVDVHKEFGGVVPELASQEHLNEITGYGRSFFDLNAKNTDKQDIFNRWKYFKDDKYFIKYVLNDSELCRLWNSVCRKYNIELMER